MATKNKIVAELGEADLVLPDRIARALIANDQVKYYFALLQTSRANADSPRLPVADLKSERLASQIPDAWLDKTVGQTKKSAPGLYTIPRAGEILARITASIAEMLSCLPEAQQETLRERAARFELKLHEPDTIAGKAIDLMTSGNRAAGDSPHLVVMDAHRAINALQAETAVETLLGASVYGLSERSKRLVTCFMTGLNRTAPLKFDHPGLATTATEHGGRLLIQNDIGTTDAHVLVLRVAGPQAILTYTDIHKPRLEFFVSLFKAFPVVWQHADTRTSDRLENSSYLLTTATYTAKDEADLARYLDHLGSRIVYLIDWNKMRKRLRAFVDKRRAVDVLRWAADHDFGHRGLLEIGGEQALAEAVEFAAGDALHYGDRLDSLIGADNAGKFLCKAMSVASSGLRQGRSRRLIKDEIKAELRRYFESSRLSIFDLAARHAETGYDLAVTLREALDQLDGQSGPPEAIAGRASAWERRADDLLNEARDDIKRYERGPALLRFFESADDAVDELEDAASLAELMRLTPSANVPFADLRALGDAVLAASQELVKCVECAATISRSDVRDDFDDFLKSLGRLIDLEHRGDELLREIRRGLVTQVENARTLYLVDLIANALEAASDAYAHAGQSLRAYLLEEVLT
jgi:uncharacterized protein Yka (UPF0111/DUF47 family)